MFLKGKEINLRALEPVDVDLLYNWENNTEIWPVSFTQIPYSKYIVEEFVNSAHQDFYTNKQLRLMIISNEKDETFGCADLFEFDPQHQRCGVGIYIHSSQRNKGYAYEAIQMMKNYCFSILNLKQIYAHVNANNSSSLALFEKAGFEKSGLKKSWHKTGLNKYEDVWFLQFLNPES